MTLDGDDPTPETETEPQEDTHSDDYGNDQEGTEQDA